MSLPNLSLPASQLRKAMIRCLFAGLTPIVTSSPGIGKSDIARQIGVGAIKYADLSVAHDSEYVFDLDRMLALTGNTGPYLQYAATRIRSIFRGKGGEPIDSEVAAQAPITLEALSEELGRRHGQPGAALLRDVEELLEELAGRDLLTREVSAG